MRKVTLTKESTKDILESLLKRSPNNYGKFESTVADILAKVKSEGDAALFAYTKEFDKAEVNKENIRVTEVEIQEATLLPRYNKESRMLSPAHILLEYSVRSSSHHSSCLQCMSHRQPGKRGFVRLYKTLHTLRITQ